jgi:hypothetical protein
MAHPSLIFLAGLALELLAVVLAIKLEESRAP